MDQTGNSFTRQVTEYMEKSLGVSGIQRLSEILSEQSGRIENQDYEKKDIAGADPVERYEREKEEGEAQRESEEGSSEQHWEQPEDPEMVNPIEVIRDIMKMGILGLVVEDPGTISNMAVEKSDFPSKRELQQGMCVISEEGPGTLDKVMTVSYTHLTLPTILRV